MRGRKPLWPVVFYNRDMQNTEAIKAWPVKTLLKRMIPGILLGFVAIIGLGLAGDLQQAGVQIQRFNGWMFPAALGFTLFNYALRFLKWHFYIRQVGASDLPWPQSLRLFVAGFPLAVTPGKAG